VRFWSDLYFVLLRSACFVFFYNSERIDVHIDDSLHICVIKI
jgi:hypothetical protein